MSTGKRTPGYEHGTDWSEQLEPGDLTPAKPGSPSRSSSLHGPALSVPLLESVRIGTASGRSRRGREERAERTLARQQMEAGVAVAKSSQYYGIDRSVRVGTTSLVEALSMFGKLVGRPVDLLQYDLGQRLEAVQRCRACRAEIVTPITDALREAKEWMAQLGALVRHDYDTHLCEPIAPQLHAYTIEQLDQMMQDAEREGVRCLARSEEIRRALDRALDKRNIELAKGEL